MKFIKAILAASIIVISMTQSVVWAKHNEPLLVLDMYNISQLPKNFRTSSNVYPDVKYVNWTGLADLHIAGGAQYSVLSLHKILEYLHDPVITIIDLRQESHGFLDGNAISWYGPHDAANAGKTPEQIEDDQSDRLDELEATAKVRVYEIIKKNSAEVIQIIKPIVVPTRRVFSEEELAVFFQIPYERIYVQDFHAPSAKQVDRFIEIVKAIPQGEWVYFHCRAGVGRTTTFMAMYDMMHNAKQVSFNDILDRQRLIGGKDMSDMPNRWKWKYKFAVERLKFLKRFYKYTRTNQDDFKTSWSEWTKKKK